MERTSERIAEDRELAIETTQAKLEGRLVIPQDAQGLVLFAHGSGSGRMSPRNQHVARLLEDQGLATLLVDLLTAEEEALDNLTRQFRFNIGMLTQRLVDIVDWIAQQSSTRALRIGCFGASTGAAAALAAAAERPGLVHAVVSRGGRPDMAGPFLPLVRAPTLLIVGGKDELVIELNREALEKLTSEKKLVIVPDATHLFEEPGTLDEVARLAADWFADHLKFLDRPSSMGPVEAGREL